MADNPWAGRIEHELPGRGRVRLVFDYDALARLEHELGDDVDLADLKTLCAAAAAALARHHPELDAAALWRLSPPVVPLKAAVERAWLAAYYGPEAAPKAAADPPGARGAAPRGLFGRLWARICGRTSSGG